MATGDRTFRGLAVPLSGESEIKQITLGTDILTITGATSMAADFLVCRDVDGNEIMALRQDGFFDLNATTTASAFAMDVRATMSATTGFNCAGNFATALGAISNTSAQCYGLRVSFDASSATSIGGGREACLHLYMKANTSSAGASHSIIHIDTAGTNPHNFITFGQGNTTGAFMVAGATDSTGTHAIRCMSGSTTFYILCSTCDPR